MSVLTSLLRVKVALALVALVSVGLGTSTNTGAYFTAVRELSGNKLSSAALAAPANLAVTKNSSGSNVISWSAATSQSWATTNNVTSGVTYRVQRTLPGQSATTIYSGTNRTYTDASSSARNLQFAAFAAGQFHTAALAVDGSVWAWGRNSSGQLGNGTTQDSAVPVRVPLPGKAKQIASSLVSTLALLEDGSVWSWGGNWEGEVGNGTTNAQTSPYHVAFPDGVTITHLGDTSSGSYSSYALASDGTFYAWGQNNNGQLGVGDATARYSPTHVNVVVRTLAAGRGHAVAITPEGSVLAWGAGGASQLGRVATASYTPSRVTFPDGASKQGFDKISAGLQFTIAEDADGQVWIWGRMGDGVSPERTTPEIIAAGGFRSLEAGYRSACIVRASDGGVVCWGDNEYGLLMDGTTTSTAHPTAATSADSKGVQTVVLSAFRAFGMAAPNTSGSTNIWAWGDDQAGLRGDNKSGASNSFWPTRVLGPKTCPAGTSLEGSNCVLPPGVTYSVDYTYADWVSLSAEKTT
ncbi:hypothetical protein [Microbacterium sp. SORGH_AS_0421]|uniref:RCC1 domain-containing protein n=1 Tax=Microbacterium sp. SORGH_AS_0421 TaxID=3041768 RepID=UPI0027D86224|nr:hypothetical protein [Microbacterium sp. SORGH_AS_0421]